VLAFGTAKIIEDQDKKMAAVQRLISKYAGDLACDVITQNQLGSIAVVEITVEHIVGKENVDPDEL
jgi:nitroimidazol reductase NimA-like FMN-containing flavoprotein (pyridoxamine 5'-phosphate oxidase superfamily)